MDELYPPRLYGNMNQLTLTGVICYMTTGSAMDGVVSRQEQGSEYVEIIIESFQSGVMSAGYRGVQVRPAAVQVFPQSLMVECSRKDNKDYPVGTRFKMKVKLTDRQDSGQFLYSSYKCPFEVIGS